jgi:hypothetical protein
MANAYLALKIALHAKIVPVLFVLLVITQAQMALACRIA